MQTEAFLGIDVSKGYADFLLLDQFKKVLENPFQLSDTKQGRIELKKLIVKWLADGITTLSCGVESTGGYEDNWYRYIKSLSKEFAVRIARLNAKGVKAISDAGLKRTITDAVSAENIAVYLISFSEKVQYANVYEATAGTEFKDARQHYTFIKMLQKQKVQLSNQLEKLLYQHFGEMIPYCRHGIPGWLLRLLTQYPCADAFIKAGPAKLSAVKGISVDKAEALINKAIQSDQLVSKQIQHVIRMTSKEILHKDLGIKAEKDILTQRFADNNDVQIVDTIPGIGLESAVALVIEIETVAKFACSKKLVSNFGVHPSFKQSGDGMWGSHMSKKGPGEVRAVLYMAALSAIRCQPLFKQLYARFRSKGMNHYQAMGVVMHKLLRVIYGMLKNKTSFNAIVDEKNIEYSETKKEQLEKEIKESRIKKNQTKHRYQTEDEQGPISGRQAQKRKKQAASQSS